MTREEGAASTALALLFLAFHLRLRVYSSRERRLVFVLAVTWFVAKSF